MATIIVNYEEMNHHLKDDSATYLLVPEINIHIMIIRNKNMVTIKNLDITPICVEQEDFVTCVLDNVLHKATVHDNAKVYLDCRKVAGVWTKNEEKDFIHIMFPTTPPHSPKVANKKRKFEVHDQQMDPKVNQALGDE